MLCKPIDFFVYRFFVLLKSIMRISALILCMSMISGVAYAKTRVIVASETWGQLIYEDSGVPKGIIADFVNRMNEVQNKFEFNLIILPRLRLNAFFIEKRADVYPLRTILWTEPNLNLIPTKTILTSGDVYFAKKTNRYGGMKIFDDLKKKIIVGVRGYHYQIFNNNPNEEYINNNFTAYLVHSNETVIKFISIGRGEVGIIPEAILANYFEDHEIRDQFIVAEQFDSRVELSNLVREDGPISVKEMNAIIDLLIKSGDVEKLKAKFNLSKR